MHEAGHCPAVAAFDCSKWNTDSFYQYYNIDSITARCHNKAVCMKLARNRGVLHFDLDAEIFIREASYLPPRTPSDQTVNEMQSVADSASAEGSRLLNGQTNISQSPLLNKKDTEDAWKQWIASYSPPEKPNRSERRAWYKRHGISRVRGDELHDQLSPESWKLGGAPKKVNGP